MYSIGFEDVDCVLLSAAVMSNLEECWLKRWTATGLEMDQTLRPQHVCCSG